MNKKLLNIFFLMLIVIVYLNGCENTDSEKPDNPITKAEDKRNRRLSVDITVASDNSFENAFNVAKSAGMDITSISLKWNELEPDIPMQYENGFLDFARAFYPPRDTPVNLSIDPIHINQKVVPIDLIDVAFDEPEMIFRYISLLDHVFAQIVDLEVVSLSIGTEIDALLYQDALLWKQYQIFYKKVRDHIKLHWPQVQVGAKSTFSGMTSFAISELQTLNQYSDVIILTYYPLNDNFTVKKLGQIPTDLNLVTQLYKNKPIYLLETGLPSSTKNNSSEAMQQQFVATIFNVWDSNKDQIEIISFTWLNDLSVETVDSIIAGIGLNDELFRAYLTTLGLRTNDGFDKLSFKALKYETQKRGWQT